MLKLNSYIKILAMAAALTGLSCSAYADRYTDMQDRNGGRLAEETKMILTTEPALSYSFAGFSKPQEVAAVLDRMKLLDIKGTFFAGARDIKAQPELMQRILKEGHELGVAVYAYKSGNFTTTVKQIEEAQKLLKTRYGVTTNLVKQPWGAVSDYTKEAVAACDCVLIGHNVNVVQSKHKAYQNALDIMPELFGKFVYSLGRGYIVNFRMDFYDKPGLCADMLQIVKEQKIDNVAYWAVNDDPKLNPQNDSAYKIKSVGALRENSKYTYSLPVAAAEAKLRYENNRVAKESLREYIAKRYIGTPSVNRDSNTLGFTQEELRYADTKGRIHTNKPVIFLGFDDWGTDQSINKLLYVLRKHDVKATFFILTKNVKNNPNLIRAIAQDGHDIASHTNMHKPLALNAKLGHMKHGMGAEERFEDLQTSYQELERYTGDIMINGKPVLTKMFRPPTLTISKLGFEELKATGFEWIVSGSYSTHDYAQENLFDMIEEFKHGLYNNGKVVKGAVFIAHMSDTAQFTPGALDVLLTLNEQRADNDPRKFIVGRLSDYLVDEYSQDNKKKAIMLER